jgi:hypothetical protein
MNTDLKNGEAVLQTLKGHWPLVIQQVSTGVHPMIYPFCSLTNFGLEELLQSGLYIDVSSETFTSG